jgi:hypothetical protein
LQWKINDQRKDTNSTGCNPYDFDVTALMRTLCMIWLTFEKNKDKKKNDQRLLRAMLMGGN